MMLTMLADVARAAGLPVVEVLGWEARTRPGGMSGVKTIVCHHTGGLNDRNTIIRGRDIGLPTELKGPLAQFFLARDGVVHVIAAGRANHAGVVLKPSYSNEFAIGIEAEAIGVPGTKGDWPEVQMAAYARLCRALIEHFGLSVLDVRGHKEVCSPRGRKSDPDFGMDAFRERVARVDLTPPKPQENPVPLSNADVELVIGHPTTLVGQSLGGAVKTTFDRVSADNLQLQVRKGLELELADPHSPLSVRLAGLDTKLDAILAALTP